MIDRQYGAITFECDACDEVLETGESDWTDAKRMFDQARWRAESVGGEWVHTCPSCTRKAF